MLAATFNADNLFNLFTLLAVAIVAVPVLKSRRKDGIISEQKAVIDSHVARIVALEQERDDARTSAERSRAEIEERGKTIAHWKASYEEQGRYTAPDALDRVEKALVSEERTMATAIQNLAELVQKDIEVTSRLVGALEGQGVTWTHRVTPPPDDC